MNFIRDGTLGFDYVEKIAIDPDEPVIYLYGKSSNGPARFVLQKFNYKTNTIAAEATHSSTSINMKIIKSSTGKELLYPQGSELYVYNAEDLSFKYSIDLENMGLFGLEDFERISENLYALVEHNNLIVASREDSVFKEVDRKPHFDEHLSSTGYTISKTNKNEILVGHYQLPDSLLFQVDNKGKLTKKGQVGISLSLDQELKPFYKEDKDKFYNLIEKKIYNSGNLTLFKSFEIPLYATGVSNDGTLILGTNNAPEQIDNPNFPYMKKIQLYNITTGTLEERNTKGYPHVVFQNKSGEIVSISSQFKQAKISDYAPAANLFVEVVE